MVINIIFTICMLGFTFWDIKTFKTTRHKDFKSIIMSLGVLGTFVGVYVGLIDFDTSNLLESVPFLLEGLKTAFYTSIVGMGLAILISIYQKSQNLTSTEFNPILSQLHRLEELNKLKDLTKIIDLLESKNKSQRNHNEKLMDFCIKTNHGLNEINISLNKAMQTLANGASKELIKALEVVISDFNNNLKEQFGDNFKELNLATKNMLIWQENYKDQIIQSNTLLISLKDNIAEINHALRDSIESSKLNLTNLEELKIYNKHNSEVQQNLISGLSALSTLQNDLNNRLQAVGELEAPSLNALKSINEFSNILSSAKTGLESYLCNYQDKLMDIFDNTANAMQDSFLRLEKNNSNILDGLKNSYHNVVKNLNDNSNSMLDSFNAFTQKHLELNNLFDIHLRKKTQNISDFTHHFSISTQDIMMHLKDTVERNIDFINKNSNLINNNMDLTFNKMQENISNFNDNFGKNLYSLSSKIHSNIESLHSSMVDIITSGSKALFNSLEINSKELLEKIHRVDSETMLNINNIYTIFKNNMDLTMQDLNIYIKNNIATLEQNYQLGMDKSINFVNNISSKFIEKMNSSYNTLHDFIKLDNEKISQNMLSNQQKNIDLITLTSENFRSNFEEKVNIFKDTFLDNLEKISLQYQDNFLKQFQLFQEDSQKNALALRDNFINNQNLNSEYLNAQILESKNYMQELYSSFSENIEKQNMRFSDHMLQKSIQMQDFMLANKASMEKNIYEQNERINQNIINNENTLNAEILKQTKRLSDFGVDSNNNMISMMHNSYNEFTKKVDSTHSHLINVFNNENEKFSNSISKMSAIIKDFMIRNEENLYKNINTQNDITDNLNHSFSKIFNILDSNISSISMAFDKTSREILGNNEAISKDLLILQKNNIETNNLLKAQNQDLLKDFYTKMLDNFTRLNKDMQDCIGNLDSYIDKVMDGFINAIGDLDNTVLDFKNHSSQNLSGTKIILRDIADEYIKIFKEIIDRNINIQNSSTTSFQENIESISASLVSLVEQNKQLSANQNNEFSKVIQSFTNNINSIINESNKLNIQIVSGIDNLDIRLAKLSDSFASNYELFLNKVKVLMNGK